MLLGHWVRRAASVRYFVAESTVTAARAAKWVAGGILSGWATIPTKNKDHLKEYVYGRRVNFDARSGQDHRLNPVFRYMMNR